VPWINIQGLWLAQAGFLIHTTGEGQGDGRLFGIDG